MPSGGPLVILALCYAAIGPGYPIAAAMVIASALFSGIQHALIIMGSPPSGDVVSDEYVIRCAVTLATATGIFIVVRVATNAEERARRLAAQSRARVDALERLERIVRRFDGSLPVRDVIQGVVEDVSREFEIALISMYLPDDQGRLSMVGVAGYHSPIQVIEMGRGAIGRAATTRQTQFIPDVLSDPDYTAARDDVRSEVAAPIVHDGELLGIVNFEGTLTRPIGPGDVALAEMLGRHIAAALRSAGLDEERRQRLHAIERVLAVSRGLLSDLERAPMMRAVVDAAADLLSADAVIVAGLDDGQYLVEGETGGRPDEAVPSPRALGPDDATAMRAIQDNERIVETVPSLDGAPDRSVMALPIRVDGTVAAVLVASRPAATPFDELAVGIADLFVMQVGVALRNADRHAMVSDAAVRDPLTNLLNRRYFDEAVETAFAIARRSQAGLALIVLDLDRFSAVNNDHGHAFGDAVLRKVARVLADTVRASDVVARYGGEEFVVIAPGAGTAEAVAVAERIRRAVAKISVPRPDGPPISITVSAGVASLLGDELDGHALFRAADSALLAAKRAGRDRVVAV